MREPPVSRLRFEVCAQGRGSVVAIDNRRLAQAAKLAGAPDDPAAGIDLHVRLGAAVEDGQPLFTVHSGSDGELAYALDYYRNQSGVIRVAEFAEQPVTG
jgi:thymidine phosphorylase